MRTQEQCVLLADVDGCGSRAEREILNPVLVEGGKCGGEVAYRDVVNVCILLHKATTSRPKVSKSSSHHHCLPSFHRAIRS